MALDGKDKITPTPFDAHEQVVRGHHTHSHQHGYQPSDQPYKPEENEGDEVSE